jgi:hypothetical protein
MLKRAKGGTTEEDQGHEMKRVRTDEGDEPMMEVDDSGGRTEESIDYDGDEMEYEHIC